MIKDNFNILKYISEDDYSQWLPLNQNMSLIDLLANEDLTRIIEGVENDEDLYDLCQISEKLSCFVLTDRKSGIPMCFCILEFEKEKEQVIFHGGRLPCYRNTMLVYRGTAKILKVLLDLQFDVVTTSNYIRSIRFNKALGFEIYKTDGNRVWMRLTRSALENSLIGRRISFIKKIEDS